MFFVYRHDDVARVLRDAETFSSAHIIDLIMGPVMGEHIMLGMDDPQHRRYRGPVSAAFRQRVLAEQETGLIARVADALIDRIRRPGTRRARPRVHLSVPDPGDRRYPGASPRGLPAVPELVHRHLERLRQARAGDRRLRRGQGVHRARSWTSDDATPEKT